MKDGAVRRPTASEYGTLRLRLEIAQSGARADVVEAAGEAGDEGR